jgi:O-antigen/teichoic acid export membrane protein
MRRRGPATSVAGRGASGTAARMVEGGLGVVLVVLTARFMGPEGRGLFALASLTLLICGLVIGPAWTAMAAELTHGRLDPPGLVGMSIVLAVAGGGIVAITASVAAFSLLDRWWIVVIPALATPFVLLSRYGEGLHLALGDIRSVNAITIARMGLPLIGVSVALALALGDAGIIAAWATGLVVLGLLVLPGARRRAGGSRPPRSLPLYRRVVGRGISLAIPGSSLMLSTRLALIVLAVMASATVVGVYSVAVAATEILFITTNALIAATFDRIRGAGPTESAALTSKTIRHAVLLTVVGGAALVPATMVLLPPLVGPGYGQVPLLCALLIPGIAGLALFGPAQTFLSVRHDVPKVVVGIAAAGLGANIVLAPLFVWVLAAPGAAIAASIANLVVAVLAAHRVAVVGGLPLRAFVPGPGDLRDYRDLARAMGKRRARGARGAG